MVKFEKPPWRTAIPEMAVLTSSSEAACVSRMEKSTTPDPT